MGCGDLDATAGARLESGDERRPVVDRRRSDGKTQLFEGVFECFLAVLGCFYNNDGLTDGDGLYFHFYIIYKEKYLVRYYLLVYIKIYKIYRKSPSTYVSPSLRTF